LAAARDIGRGDGDVIASATHDLYNRYGRQIYAYCLHHLKSREEAEDAVQTTFMNVFRGLQRGTVAHSEQAWLFKIAHNVCLSRQSSSWRRRRVETPNDFEVLQEIIPSPPRTGADELIGLEDALEAMPENQRRAILLREWQGLSYREICAELKLSQASVEMLIFRARRSLASALAPAEAPQGVPAAGPQLNLSALLAGLKSALTGSAMVKAVAVAVAASTVGVAVQPVEHSLTKRGTRKGSARVTAPALAVSAPARTLSVAASASVALRVARAPVRVEKAAPVVAASVEARVVAPPAPVPVQESAPPSPVSAPSPLAPSAPAPSTVTQPVPPADTADAPASVDTPPASVPLAAVLVQAGNDGAHGNGQGRGHDH